MTSKNIIDTATACLKAATYSPRKLSTLHAGVTAGVTLAFGLVTYLLSGSMDAAVGLSGLDTRTTLRFIQTVLMFFLSVAIPFWELGYARAALLYSQNQTPRPGDLLQGFHRFWPALGLMTVRLVAVFGVMYLCIQITFVLYMLSPFATPLLQALSELPMLTPEYLDPLQHMLTPVYVLYVVLVVGALLWLFYRFRLADFALMDGQKPFASLGASFRCTKKRWKQLIRLDLRFWWYYLALGLCVTVSYLDVLLPFIGINEDVAFWLCTVIGQLGNFAVLSLANPLVQTSVALFYSQETA